MTAPTELTGAGNQYYDAGSQTQFFRPAGSGSFSLHATASDGQSTVAQVAFPNVGSVNGWAGSIGGADGSSPYTSPNDYSWSSGATAPGARSITATNAAAIDGVATITLAADSTAPTGQALTLTGANAPYYNAASVTFSLVDGSDPAGGAGLDTSTRSVSRETGDLVAGNCSNFSPDAGSFSSPDTAVSTGHCYRYSFTIADNVGNVSTAVSATAKVDIDAPNTTIDSSPSDPSGNTTPSFSFSSSESGSTFECRVDGGSWSSCTSPDTISPALSGGSHTFDVRATDAAGNTDATPASYTWTVDLTAPNTTIDSSPADPSNNTTPTSPSALPRAARASNAASTAAAGRPAPARESISPALTAGSHTFQVRATDTAGNTDATPASYTWTVDLTAPNTTIDSSPADPSNNTTPSFTFSSSEAGSTFECRVDGGSWTSCTSPDTDLARTDRRQPHLRRARHGCGRQHRRHTGQLHLDGRPDRAEHDHRLEPGRPVQRHHPELHVQLDRGRLDLRVPRRRRQLDVLHQPATPISPALDAQAATPSRCAQPTRPATPTPPRPATPGRST